MILDELQARILSRVEELSPEQLRLHKVVLGTSLSTMKDSSQVFSNLHPCIVLLPQAQGFAYFHDGLDTSLERFVGKDVRDILNSNEDIPLYFRIALIDALYCAVGGESGTRFLRGDLAAKARERARIVFEKVPDGATVLLLGVVSEFVAEAKRKQIDLHVFDLTNQKIGRDYYGVPVQKSAPLTVLLSQVPSTTHVIASGMTFVSNTADELFDTVQKRGLELHLFMETGGHFGTELLSMGAHAVFAEHFPFYDFYGDTRVTYSVQELSVQ